MRVVHKLHVNVRVSFRCVSNFSHIKRVGILGGGVAGLQVAKSLAAANIEPILFEKEKKVGGVWQSNYSSYGLQVPKQLYEFPDFKFNVASGSFQNGAAVQKYIESYVAENNLKKYIHCSTSVQKVEQTGTTDKQGWKITIKDQTTGSLRTELVDYVVISTGMYSTPNMPAFQGQEKFRGQIIHSSTFTNNATAKDKNVVIVGAGKSAIDTAVETSKVSKQSTILMNSPHWGVPRKIAGLIPFQYIFLSRFGQALASWYKGAWPTAPQSVQFTSSLLQPIMRPVFAIVEALFAFQLGHAGDYYAKNVDIVKDFYGYAHVLDSSFKKALKSNKISFAKDEIVQISEKSVILKSGKEIPCDLLICATGYQKFYGYFTPEIVQQLNIEKDGLYLYRHCLPTNIPNLAFIGSEVATISNIMTYRIQAQWLTSLLTGKMKLPSKEVMKKEVDEMKAWKRSWMTETRSRASLVLLHQTHYHDSLLQDMKQPHRRKGRNVLAELFMPYQAGDYDSISVVSATTTGK